MVAGVEAGGEGTHRREDARARSVLAGPEQRGGAAVRFGDDPEPVVGRVECARDRLGERVRAEEPVAVLDRSIVLLPVLRWELTPVAGGMTPYGLERELSEGSVLGDRARSQRVSSRRGRGGRSCGPPSPAPAPSSGADGVYSQPMTPNVSAYSAHVSTSSCAWAPNASAHCPRPRLPPVAPGASRRLRPWARSPSRRGARAPSAAPPGPRPPPLVPSFTSFVAIRHLPRVQAPAACAR